jgi:hypothetical protein
VDLKKSTNVELRKGCLNRAAAHLGYAVVKAFNVCGLNRLAAKSNKARRLHFPD